MDRARGNIVVSRRWVEENRAEARSDLIENLGRAIVKGIKNITDYGAFVDFGGIEVCFTSLTFLKRVNHPSEALDVGAEVEVQIIRYNQENGRISLGMKQLESDPWQGVEDQFVANARFKGTVTNITDYGAFVEILDGIEGLIHVSEMSWTNKNIHPNKLVESGQELEVMVLEVDADTRRISLGLKQQCNPWEAYAKDHKDGETIEGEIRNITEFGLFVALGPEIDGMVHVSDVSCWKMLAKTF